MRSQLLVCFQIRNKTLNEYLNGYKGPKQYDLDALPLAKANRISAMLQRRGPEKEARNRNGPAEVQGAQCVR
jgi:hypothetical protein